MKEKIEKVICNCISCILSEKKGRQEGFLNVLEKGSVPLDTYRIWILYQQFKSDINIYSLSLMGLQSLFGFTQKTIGTSEVIGHLQKQAAVLGNPHRIISDRWSAFTSHEFKEYCKQKNIHRHLITTGIPKANGQVERLNRVIITLLTKLSAPKPQE